MYRNKFRILFAAFYFYLYRLKETGCQFDPPSPPLLYFYNIFLSSLLQILSSYTHVWKCPDRRVEGVVATSAKVGENVGVFFNNAVNARKSAKRPLFKTNYFSSEFVKNGRVFSAFSNRGKMFYNCFGFVNDRVTILFFYVYYFRMLYEQNFVRYGVAIFLLCVVYPRNDEYET